MNCNKIKKLGVKDVKQIVEAVSNAENLELNSDKTMLRRKDLTELPEFKAQKKSKVENGANN